MKANRKASVAGAKKNKMRKGFAAVALAAGTLTGALAVGVGPAAATSTKCAFYGTGIKYAVRNGSFCATVNGSGTYISTVSGNYGITVASMWWDGVCNGWLKLEIYDRWGNLVATRNGGRSSGCTVLTYNTPPSIGVYGSFPSASGGTARVSLMRGDGTVVATNVTGLG